MNPTEQIRKRIKELRELGEKATPGPWVTERFDSDNGYIHFSVNDAEMQQVCFCHEDMHPKTYRHDANLIAASRTALPLALEVIEELVGALVGGSSTGGVFWREEALALAAEKLEAKS